MGSNDSPLLTAAKWLGIAMVGGLALVIALTVLLALLGVAVGLLWAIVGLASSALPYVLVGALLWVAYQYYTSTNEPARTASERAATDGGAGPVSNDGDARSTTEPGAAPTSDEDPMEALRRQYVAGELNDVEFERRMDRLLELQRRDADADGGAGRGRDPIVESH